MYSRHDDHYNVKSSSSLGQQSDQTLGFFTQLFYWFSYIEPTLIWIKKISLSLKQDFYHLPVGNARGRRTNWKSGIKYTTKEKNTPKQSDQWYNNSWQRGFPLTQMNVALRCDWVVHRDTVYVWGASQCVNHMCICVFVRRFCLWVCMCECGRVWFQSAASETLALGKADKTLWSQVVNGSGEMTTWPAS